MTVSKSIHNNNPEITNKFLQASGITAYRIINFSPCIGMSWIVAISRVLYPGLELQGKYAKSVQNIRNTNRRYHNSNVVYLYYSGTLTVQIDVLDRWIRPRTVQYYYYYYDSTRYVILWTVYYYYISALLQYRNICVPMMISSLGRASTIFVDVSQLLLDRSTSCTTFRFPFVCRPLTNASERTIITKLLSGKILSHRSAQCLYTIRSVRSDDRGNTRWHSSAVK